jgi:hypothetical protein
MPAIGHGSALGDGPAAVGDSDAVTPDRHRRVSTFFAVFVPLAYLTLMAYMIVAKASSAVADLGSGEAAALVGGVAALIIFLASFVCDRKSFMESSAEHVVNGLVFAFKAMGVVLPIAGFFFIGNGEFAGQILGMDDSAQGPAFLYDLVTAAQEHIPNNPVIASFGILVIGMVAGLEGSGFSGLHSPARSREALGLPRT